MTSITPVILSGGAGTRLWPLSTQNLPKQFLPLLSDKSLLQETILRLSGLAGVTLPVIVCNEKHCSLVDEQLKAIDVPAQAVFLEPIGRNTAPAIALVAMQALAAGEDPILLVLPSDHAIADVNKLHEAIDLARVYAKRGNLVAFGVAPTRAETGYGYIKFAERLGEDSVYQIDKFVEKPNSVTAEEYVASGCYCWNSGMFMFRASIFLLELQNFAPDIHQACRKVLAGVVKHDNCFELQKDDFIACPSDSIDYAVMEKTKNSLVIPINEAGWSDIGSWQALWECVKKDAQGNVVIGDAVLHGVEDSYVHNSQNKKIVALGLKDIIVVTVGDTLLVAHKDECQKIKDLL